MMKCLIKCLALSALGNNVEIYCDEKQFSIIFNNLILNGIQAIANSGTIEITVEENNDKIIIQIKDSGKGIPKQNLNSIFEVKPKRINVAPKCSAELSPSLLY